MDPVLFLGVGSIAAAVRAACPERRTLGTTRSAPDARFAHIEPIALNDTQAVKAAARGAHVVVSFPPDGHTDREMAALCGGATRLVYLSSSAVYPLDAGTVTESTPVAPYDDRAKLRLNAEASWLEAGASVVRLPAFYGPSTGLHRSLARGTFRMPGTGMNIVSRVHVADAARFVLAALAAPPRSVLLAGDNEPAKVADVVSFVCALFDLPLPRSSEGAETPATLRGSRSIDNHLTRASFGVRLAYPSYREGYQAVKSAIE